MNKTTQRTTEEALRAGANGATISPSIGDRMGPFVVLHRNGSDVNEVSMVVGPFQSANAVLAYLKRLQPEFAFRCEVVNFYFDQGDQG